MKWKLAYPSSPPRGGLYRLNNKEKGIVAEGYIIDQVLERVRKYRIANGIPIGLNFEQEVIDEICEHYPLECIQYDPTIPDHNRRLGLNDIMHGTTVMAKHWLGGSETVSDEEALRRAKICANCRYNVQFSKPCGGICPELKKLVTSILGTKKTPMDSNLKSCAICACYLSASVWLPLETQCVGVDDEQKKTFQKITWCWKQCLASTETPSTT